MSKNVVVYQLGLNGGTKSVIVDTESEEEKLTGNPVCPKTNALGRKCNGLLIRQHSGRRAFWVCQNNKKHRFLVGSNLHQPQPKEEA